MIVLLMIQNLATHLLVLVYLCSLAGKLTNWKEFRQGLLFIPSVNKSLSYIIATMLPFLEVAVVICLCYGFKWGMHLGLVMHSCFVAVTIIILRKKIIVKCNCYGVKGESNFSIRTVIENLFFMLIIMSNLFQTEPPTLRLQAWLIAASLIAVSVSATNYGRTISETRWSNGVY